MPGGDGTGPMGYGMMTDRGAGYCAGFATPGYANPSGRGLGYGRGRGFRRMYRRAAFPGYGHYWNPGYAAPFAEVYDEREILSRQAKILEQQLRQIEKRLAGLEKNETDEDDE